MFIISCGPSSINHYHGPDKSLVSENTQTRGGGGGGTGDGGGGQGIACSGEVKDDKLKNRLFVRDIFEAIINHRRTMKSVEGTAESSDKVDAQAIQVLVNSIKYHFGPATSNLEFGNEKFWIEFAEKISFLNEDTPLFPSNDANSPIALPVGCQITQLAYWDESAGSASEGTLYVDRKRWQQLDQFNKIALLAHEYFFKQARKAGYKNSDFIRYKVGQLLSVEGLEPIFKEWIPAKDPRVKDILPESKNGFKYCTGTSAEDPTAELQFYQYEGKDKRQHFVIPFLKTNTINFSLLQDIHFNFDPKVNTWLAEGTDSLIYGTDFGGEDEVARIVLMSDNVFSGVMNFNFWYYGTGLFFTSGDLASEVSVKKDIRSLMTQLKSSKKPSIWATSINSASQSIQISLLNPFLDYKEVERKLKSKEDLITSANGRIENSLYRLLASSDLGVAAKYSKINNAIAILNKEIDDAVKQGVYPGEFINWVSSLEELGRFGKIRKSDVANELEGFGWADYRVLKSELPSLLFKIKLNNYDESDVDHGIGSYGFNYYNQISGDGPIGRGKIQLRQGNSSLKLDMTCKDFTTVFSSKTMRNYLFDSAPNIKVNIGYELNSFAIEDEKPVEVINFLKFITTKKSNFETNQNFWNTNKYRCDRYYVGEGLNCDDFKMFAADLSNETKIDVFPCKVYHEKLGIYDGFRESRIDDGTIVRNSCAILKLNSSMNSYIINFSNYYEQPEYLNQSNVEKVESVGAKDNNDNSSHKILFIRRIPF